MQATAAITYTVARAVQDTSAETKITNHSAGLEIGIENAMEAGGTVSVAEAKDTIKVSAKGTYGIQIWEPKHDSDRDGLQRTGG
ncbi:MAG TPA: hypothetical protein VMZ90_12585 [Vicinamibacterales bacterium]|nr:hypothetical protein [Vicinamibacterales bacterium]